MTRFLHAIALLLAVTTTASAQAGKDFFFKDGDIVVMMGDSITEQRLYSTYVEMWSVSRFPNWKLTFRNVGIGGDTSGGGNGRFKRDVLTHKATAMTVDFGMNDGGYQPFNEQRFNNYMKGLQGIANQAKEAKVRVAWVTPQPVEHAPGDKGAKSELYNDTLEKFSDGVKQIAEKNGGLFVDQFHPYWAVMKKARAAGEKNRITGGDAVHPGPPGQAVMAAAILKGLNFPQRVSNVSFSVKGNKSEVQGDNCMVKLGPFSESTYVFTRLDKALPFFPDEAKSILKWTPLADEMNQLGLTVKDLPKGTYEIRLGDKTVAEYSAEELASGVNLASATLKAGPIADQVKKVWKAVRDKTDYYHGQIYRGLILAGAKSPAFKDVDPKDINAKREALVAERMKKMPELDAAIRQALEMRPYTVVVDHKK